jgi:hypothetical protein
MVKKSLVQQIKGFTIPGIKEGRGAKGVKPNPRLCRGLYKMITNNNWIKETYYNSLFVLE